jgi:NCAIR mutase (PurE)-related protein
VPLAAQSNQNVVAAKRNVTVACTYSGAMPSVIAGLVRCPVVAVPTSVGYGAAFGKRVILIHVIVPLCYSTAADYLVHWLDCAHSSQLSAQC